MKLKIVHGSCEDMSDIKDNSIGGVITSPPYFSAKIYADEVKGNIGSAKIDTFNTPYQNYLNMMRNVFAEVYRVLKDGRYFMMNAAPIVYEENRYPVPYHLFNLMEEVGFNYCDNIIWKKPEGITSSKRFGVVMQNPYPLYYKPNNIYEPCFLMRKGKTNYDGIDKTPTLDILYLKKYQNDIWEIQPDTQSEHPAPFPYRLPWNFIYSLLPRNEIVLDMFGGSGTTALAARDLDVDCVLYELESKYIELIKKRVASNQGLGKFVEGAKDIQLEVLKQKENPKVLIPTLSLSSSQSDKITSGHPAKKKQVEIHKLRLYVCDICEIEWEITNNQYFSYKLYEWCNFKGLCPTCEIKVREIK